MAAICFDECAMLARHTELYMASVRMRLLPAIVGPDASARERVQDVYEGVIAATSDSGSEPDFMLAFSAAEDVEIEALDDLAFVQEHVLGLAIAGLFNFWERSMRRILLRAIRFRLPVPDRKAIERADMPQLLEALHASGNHMPPPAVVEQLQELRLIANVVKHGAGTSLRELAERYPGRFDGMPAHMVDPDILFLTEDDLVAFGDTIVTFWRSIADQPQRPTHRTSEP